MLYHNQQLGARVQSCGVVDRWVRVPGLTLEGLLTLAIATSPEGIAFIVLCIEYVSEGNPPSLSIPLAMYPMTQQAHAQEDALLLSRKWDISLRRATQGTGWEMVRETDLAKEGSSELIIGG